MNNAVTLDKVEIQISASAGEANSNIASLSETLSQLKSSVKGGFNNLSKLAKSLEELKTASASMKGLSENLESVSSTLANSFGMLSNIPSPTGLTKMIKNIEKLPEVFNRIDTKTLSNVARVSNALSDALSPLASKLADIGYGFSKINQLANRYGVSITKVRESTKKSVDYSKMYSKSLISINQGFKNVQKSNENFFKSLSKNASNVISKVKQIGLSLLGTRTIFTATRKAVSEYMAMDAELTWKITNNWRALGAQLAPAIENVIWLFKQFVRVIYSVILALTGIDLISRANEKAMAGWGKSAKDTLGNLQKFDDLNVVEFPKSGSGADDNKLIELDTIDLTPIQKVIDWVRKLRDEIKAAWSSEEWEGVGKVLAEGINGILNWIDFDWIEEKFRGIAEKFGDFLTGFVNEFEWDTFGKKLTQQLAMVPYLLKIFLDEVPWEDIGTHLNEALRTFKPEVIINAIGGVITGLVDGLQKAFLKLDASILATKISDTIKSVLSNIGSLISTINWGEIGDKIHDVFVNIDWKGIWEEVVNIFKETFQGLDEFMENLLGADSGAWDAIKTAIVGIGVALVTYKIVDGIGKIVLFMKELPIVLGAITSSASPLLAAIIPIGLAIAGIYLVIQGIKDIISGDVIQGIPKLLTGIALILAGIALAIGSVPLLIAAAVAAVVAIVAGLVSEIVKHWDEIKETFSKLGKKISEGWDKIKEKTKETFSKMKEHAKEGWDNIKQGFTKFGEGISKFWNEKIWSKAKKIPENLKGIINDAIGFVKKAFEGLTNFFGDFWTALKGGPKSFANFVIEKIEWLVNKIISGLNWLVKQLNKFSFDVPDWVPGIGGKTMGFDIKEFSTISLPRLAGGTNDIPQDGPYYLHANEAVVPKKYNPAIGGGTNEETNRRLDTLIDVLTNMETTTVVNVGNDRLYQQQQRYTRRQNDKYGTDVNL